jgi:hypothetical protein
MAMTRVDDRTELRGGPYRIGGTEWRPNGPHLWVGRDGARTVGTIEHYGHYWATDTDGVAYGYFTQFADCARALQRPAVAPRLPLERIQRRRERALVLGSSLAVLTTFALCAYGWVLLV